MSIENYKAWMKESTTAEKCAVSAEAQTSFAMLYQLASDHRRASPDLAARLSKAIAQVRREGLPDVVQGDISEVCANCSYYQYGCMK